MLEQKTGAIATRRHPRLGELLKTVPTLQPTDSVAKALGHFGRAGVDVLPVLQGPFLAGVVREAELIAWAAERGAPAIAGGAAHDTMLVTLMRPARETLDADDTIETALARFQEIALGALPVVDACGAYLGVITRQKLLAALTRTLAPERIGGMATPFGVYLTTGNQSAGVGFWSLFCTGALSSLTLGLVSTGVYYVLAPVFRALPFTVENLLGRVWPAQAYTALLTLLRDEGALCDAGTLVVSLLGFLLLLRLSPLSGYHAAEHQTVNAIERGEALTPEVVARMPREHPRCGTNLMALLFAGQLLIPWIAQEPLALLPTALVVATTWRKVGGWLQRVFTTKPARLHQLASGIRAGAALLDAYAANPTYRAGRWRRIWNMGLVQVLLGGLSVLALCTLLAWIFPSTRGIF